MFRRCSVLLAASFIALLAGCSQYNYDYQYAPRPAIANIPSPNTQQSTPPVAVQISVIGVRYDDSRDNIPPSVEIRLRMDNNGPNTVTFDPHSLSLVNGELMQFMPPIVQPPQAATLPPATSTVYSAFFPFPTGHSYYDIDMESLQLRWLLQLDGKKVGQIVDFHRYYNNYYYYDPYWDSPPYYYYGGGVVVVHRRW